MFYIFYAITGNPATTPAAAAAPDDLSAIAHPAPVHTNSITWPTTSNLAVAHAPDVDVGVNVPAGVLSATVHINDILVPVKVASANEYALVPVTLISATGIAGSIAPVVTVWDIALSGQILHPVFTADTALLRITSSFTISSSI